MRYQVGHVINLIFRAHQRANLAFLDKTKELTPTQNIVLQELARGQRVHQAALVADTHIDRSTLSETVRRLELRGFVERIRDPDDTRAYLVTLTKAGKLLAQQAAVMERHVMDDVLSSLSAQKKTELLEALITLIQNPSKTT